MVRTRAAAAAAAAHAALAAEAPPVPNSAAAAKTVAGLPSVKQHVSTPKVLTAPPLFLARFCAGWVHCSLGTIAVSLLEKQKRWPDAVELLRLLLGGNACVGRRGEWWERLAINLEHQGLPEQALEVRQVYTMAYLTPVNHTAAVPTAYARIKLVCQMLEAANSVVYQFES